MSSGNYSMTVSKVSWIVYFSFSIIFMFITPSSSFSDVISFFSSSSFSTPSFISIEEVSSGNSCITLPTVSQIFTFSQSVISLCITPSSHFYDVISLLSTSSLFTPSSISTVEVSSGNPSITLSKVSLLVSCSFSVNKLPVTLFYVCPNQDQC